MCVCVSVDKTHLVSNIDDCRHDGDEHIGCRQIGSWVFSKPADKGTDTDTNRGRDGYHANTQHTAHNTTEALWW